MNCWGWLWNGLNRGCHLESIHNHCESSRKYLRVKCGFNCAKMHHGWIPSSCLRYYGIPCDLVSHDLFVAIIIQCEDNGHRSYFEVNIHDPCTVILRRKRVKKKCPEVTSLKSSLYCSDGCMPTYPEHDYSAGSKCAISNSIDVHYFLDWFLGRFWIDFASQYFWNAVNRRSTIFRNCCYSFIEDRCRNSWYSLN